MDEDRHHPASDILDHLTINHRGKRPQLTNEQKNLFAEKLCAIVGLDPRQVDIRTLSDEKQTARSISESNGAIKNASIPISERIFVMRCTGDPSTLPKIEKYMDENVQRAGGLALQIAKEPKWQVYKIYFTKEKSKEAHQLAKHFEVAGSRLCEISVSTSDASINTSLPTESHIHREPTDIYLSKEIRSKFNKTLTTKKCVVLQGPPGTGKTLLANNLSRQFVGKDGEIASIQFHANFSYDDFVQGWRPTETGFELIEGHFMDFCDLAASNPEKRFLLLIDEINRGNVSSIFGECFSLIEATKRGPEYSINLSYREPGSGFREFYVPQNIFIVGTMNTADRAIAIVDYAFRRRFSFIEMKPAFDDADFHEYLHTLGLPKTFVAQLADRFVQLNNQIRNETRNLGPGFEIGHSYFCSDVPKKNFEEWYDLIIDHEIGPLLREYWFDDPAFVEARINELRI